VIDQQIGDVRHLVYHLYPAKREGGAVWRRRLADLRPRLPLFNGRRVLAIVTDRTTSPTSEVIDAIRGLFDETLWLRNLPCRREGVSLIQLYGAIEKYSGPADVTLHAHAKGISSESWATGARLWVDALHETCLDYWPVVRDLLRRFPVVGPFKRAWTDWKQAGFRSKSTWHYSGAWRWFRNSEMFRRAWRHVEPFYCGSESHPSLVFVEPEAGNICCPITDRGQALYTREYWDATASAQLAAFRAANQHSRQDPYLMTCVLTSHRKPQRVHDAIRSVQAQTTPDWQLLIVDSGDLVEELSVYESDPRILVVNIAETEEHRKRWGMQAWTINWTRDQGHVRGNLVMHLCDDDVYHPDAFARMISVAREHPTQNAWCGTATRYTVLADGTTVRGGMMPNYRLDTPLDCMVDGMQVCVRSEYNAPWNDQKAVAWHADGRWIEAVRATTQIHPVPIDVGQHRHCPESAFTRTTSAGALQEHNRPRGRT